MTFLAILVAMIGARIPFLRMKNYRWRRILRWVQWVRKAYADRFPYVTGLVALQVALPVMALAAVLALVTSGLGLVGDLLLWFSSVLALVWGMGSSGYQARVNRVIEEAEEPDSDHVGEYFTEQFICGHTVHTRQDLVEVLPGAFMITVLRYQFSPIFWFVVFSIPGLLMYVIVRTISEEKSNLPDHAALERPFCQHWLEWLDWLPARLVAISISFAGYVGRSTDYALQSVRQWGWRAEYLLNETSWAALGIDHSQSWHVQLLGMRRLAELYARTVWVWTIILALLVIISSVID